MNDVLGAVAGFVVMAFSYPLKSGIGRNPHQGTHPKADLGEHTFYISDFHLAGKWISQQIKVRQKHHGWNRQRCVSEEGSSFHFMRVEV